jgi:hypothetical protein
MAIYFISASSEYLTVPNEANYDFTTAISISLWMRTNGTWNTNTQPIIGKDTAGWALTRNGNGSRGLRWTTPGLSTTSLNWTGTADDSVWHHVLVTFGSGSKYIIFDGTSVASATGLTGSLNTNNTTLTIGSLIGVARYFNGWIHDVRIYNRQLNLEEGRTLFYNRGLDGLINGLVSRWTMDGGYPTQVISGATVLDIGPYQNHASPSGSPEWADSPYGDRARRAI